MNHINRESQRKILTTAAAIYPEWLHAHALFHEPGFAANVAYLEQHGLLDAKWTQSLNSPSHPNMLRIRAAGIDFLLDDGGLGAILNVVVVRFEAETLRALLVHHVEKADGDKSTKDKLIEQIKAAPADVLKELTKKGLDAALPYVPGLIGVLSSLLK